MAKDFSIQMDANLAPAVRQFVKFAQQVQSTEGGLKKITQAAGQAARQMDTAGDSGAKAGNKMSSAFDGLTSSLAGLVGGGGLLALMAQNLRDVQDASDEAARALAAQEQALKNLIQISGSVKDFNERVNLSRRIAVREGVTFTKGAQIVFAADSAGVAADTNFFASVNRFADPLAAIELDSKLSGSFGRTEVGTPEQVVSKGLVGSARSLVAFNEFAPALSVAAASSAGIGGSEEELIGLLAGLTKVTKSPDIGANLIRTLNEEVDRAKFSGKGTLAGLDRFARENPELFAKRFEERPPFKDAVTAVRANRELIDSIISDVDAANDLTPLRQRQEIAASSDVLTALRLRGGAAARREILGDQRGVDSLRAQAAVDDLVSRSIAAGDPPSLTAAIKSSAERNRTLFGLGGGDDSFSRNEGDFAGGFVPDTFLSAMSQIFSYFYRVVDAPQRPATEPTNPFERIGEVMFQNNEELKQMRREARERDRLKSGVPSLRGPGQDRAEDTRTGQ